MLAEMFKSMQDRVIGDIPWLSKMEKGILPSINDVKGDLVRGIESIMIRDRYVDKFGFVLVTTEFIDALSRFISGQKILEIGSGNGFLAKCLKDKGIDIIATDNYDWENDERPSWKKHYIDIIKMNHIKAMEKYLDEVDIVLLVWPEYQSQYSVDVVSKCIEKRKKMIYIGEWIGGCTACDEFFEIIGKNISFHFLMGVEYMPFYGLHDEVFFFDFDHESHILGK